MSREVPRRGVLQGMGALGVGVGGVSGSPAQIADALDEALDEATAGDHDPHTVATWRAVVDAVVPPTPDLADELGDEHEPGGLAVELEVGLIEFVNGFLSPEGTVPRVAPTGETAPLAESIAAVLDAAAAELLARGGNRDQPARRFEGGGPFASLSRRDRFLAMHDVEENGGKYGGFVVAIVAAFPAILYYSEWSGYDDFSALPSERTFSGDVQSWTQTDYEGPVDGAAVLRGYEVDEFEETYEAETGPGRTEGDRGDGGNGEAGRGDGGEGRDERDAEAGDGDDAGIGDGDAADSEVVDAADSEVVDAADSEVVDVDDSEDVGAGDPEGTDFAGLLDDDAGSGGELP